MESSGEGKTLRVEVKVESSRRASIVVTELMSTMRVIVPWSDECPLK